ncbi:hypothetical protein BJ165DRAFT_1445348 [Panaeolus papilionaceus]|nr:hypothetical protein BJ165DRAFT_1445348 [Panaeolus papilionaceus]
MIMTTVLIVTTSFSIAFHELRIVGHWLWFLSFIPYSPLSHAYIMFTSYIHIPCSGWCTRCWSRTVYK